MKKVALIFITLILSFNIQGQNIRWLIDNFSTYLNSNCDEYVNKSETTIQYLQGVDKEDAIAIEHLFKSMADCNDAMGCPIEEYYKAIKLLGITPVLATSSGSCVDIYEIQIGRLYYRVALGNYKHDIIVTSEVSTTDGSNNYNAKYKFGIFEGRVRIFESNAHDKIRFFKSLDCSRANPFGSDAVNSSDQTFNKQEEKADNYKNTKLPNSQFSIGQSYLGGIIFYLDNTGQHGLITTKNDISSSSKWQDAIKLCERYQGGGWHLPTIYELDLLYDQKDIVGGFSTGTYWSSTEGKNGEMCTHGFGSGSHNTFSKYFYGYVRPVRSF